MVLLSVNVLLNILTVACRRINRGTEISINDPIFCISIFSLRRPIVEYSPFFLNMGSYKGSLFAYSNRICQEGKFLPSSERSQIIVAIQKKNFFFQSIDMRSKRNLTFLSLLGKQKRHDLHFASTWKSC
jgi:hypothetical protein